MASCALFFSCGGCVWRIFSASIRRGSHDAMAMPPPSDSAVSIAILAKAPVPGFAKTRLIPSIGAHAAAVLQERLTEQTVATAVAAGIGPVTLWAAPDARHPSFIKLVLQQRIMLKPQPQGDLGVRMLT